MSETNGGRHKGREVALQVLYAIDLAETGARDARASRAARAELEAAKIAEGRSDAGDDASIAAKAQETADDEEEGVLASVDPEQASGIAFDRITEHFDVPRSAIDFARELVHGVAARVAELDGVIGQHARNWRVSRMAAVDRNVLRLAVFELGQTETPVAVVIDEAVDLARRFGSDPSPAFVNGILDAAAREVRAA